MTKREMLHDLVDRLPEDEISLAIRLLEAIEQTEQPTPSYTIENAPVDDEPFDRADIEGLEHEPLLPHDDVVRRLRR